MIILLQAIVTYAQVDHKKAFQTALKRGEIGKEISISEKGKNHDSLVLVYLGEIETKKHRHLKVLTSRWYWGLAPRATSRIIIFNRKDQYLGDFYLTMTCDVPDRIEGAFLVFTSKKECDDTPGLVTKISFRNGIPKTFLLDFGEGGNIYSFAQNL